MEKHYARTVDINVLVGNLPNPQDVEGLRRQIDLIESEIEEGKANLHLIQANPEALRDDVMDILFTAYGLAGRMDLSYRYLLMPFVSTGKTKFSEIAELIVGQLPAEIDRFQVAVAGLDSLTQTLSSIREHIEIDLDYSKALIPHLILCGYLLAHGLSYPTDEDYEEVIRSNLSKFDEDLDGVEATKAKYKALGVDIVISEGILPELGDEPSKRLYVAKSTRDQEDSEGRSWPKGKWVKGVGFEEPEYRPLQSVVQEVEPTTRDETPVGFILDEAPFYKEGDAPTSDEGGVTDISVDTADSDEAV